MQRWIRFTGQTVAAGVLAWSLLWLTRPDAPPAGPAVDLSLPVASPVAQQPMPASDAHASYSAAVRIAMPSVVNIYTAKQMPRGRGWLDQRRHDYGEGVPQRATSLGSGVIWRPDGYIVTNYHVVEGADEIAVVLPQRAPLRARVVGADPESDLAVLRVEARELPAIQRRGGNSLDIGDVVLAIGNPFGVGQTVTQGIVSATGRNHLGINTFENFVQTDASINPGNSGGALVDTAGQLVGINTAIYTRSEGSVGIGFAIPVDLVDTVAEALMAGGRVRRGWLGIQAQDVDTALADNLSLPVRGGVLVAAVEPRGPADRGGLRPGDVIKAVDGRPVTDSAALTQLAAAGKPGSSIQLDIERRGARVTLAVTLGQRPALRRIED
ncbi:S1C family serine protease [Roseateles saccharophilus]|uniref:Serine protease DegQ n=1 Tax=Roseateles saccharophilus TaxID=304 RepID=A0A4R3URS0_ROSSA|nr:trypsin-like peptidase domain-containing protein [Roseateles saccharophilus]MDG0833158.1 PDZ domain-containing protein [Roseateles saccharophilus]TCU94626.1 serine protease DegQ [Roseateles saccharophilus]